MRSEYALHGRTQTGADGVAVVAIDRYFGLEGIQHDGCNLRRFSSPLCQQRRSGCWQALRSPNTSRARILAPVPDDVLNTDATNLARIVRSPSLLQSDCRAVLAARVSEARGTFEFSDTVRLAGCCTWL